MKRLLNLNLYKEHRLTHEYKDIIGIEKDAEYIFKLDEVKTIIGPNRFSRETDEYRFELDIKNKKCIYILKEQNVKLDIEVEKINYKKEKNNIILEYKISSDEETFMIKINVKDDINE